MSRSIRIVTSATMLIVSSLLLVSCAQPVEVVEEAVEVAEAPAPEPEVIEEPRIPPTWEQSVSTADFAQCKLLDPRPASVKELFRGQKRGDIIGRDNVGFPRTEREIPGLGVGNIIAAKVSFDDAPPSEDFPEDFLEDQTQFMTEWSEFFSQGKFRYEFQVVDGWVNVPVDHADYPIDPGVGDNEYDQEEFQRLMNTRMETIAKLVVAELPTDLDYAAADAMFVYWTPEMYAFTQSVSYRNGLFSTPQGTQRVPFSGGGTYHTTDSGSLTLGIKQEFMWSWWLHDILHFQGMNGHAPGNGWQTGVGQGAYPKSGEYSGTLTAWETFLLEWYEDSQVHCVDRETLEEPQQVMLTPLEIYAGDRKMVAIRVDDYKVIVVESRRPIGYSQWWVPDNSGILVYEVDADGVHTDHVPNDCGNDRAAPKWAYYLYPDHFQDVTCVPNDLESIMVREGDTVTYAGVKVSLEYSDDELDYVRIERAKD